jgi:hypothetical protein
VPTGGFEAPQRVSQNAVELWRHNHRPIGFGGETIELRAPAWNRVNLDDLTSAER